MKSLEVWNPVAEILTLTIACRGQISVKWLSHSGVPEYRNRCGLPGPAGSAANKTSVLERHRSKSGIAEGRVLSLVRNTPLPKWLRHPRGRHRTRHEARCQLQRPLRIRWPQPVVRNSDNRVRS